MPKLTVKASKKYDVLIGQELLPRIGILLGEVSSAKKVCVVCDTTTKDLFAGVVTTAIANEGYEVHLLVFAPGETSKNMTNVTRILEQLAKKEFTRTDLLIALGGGVIGDMTGFAAATYLRGIDFLQIPTTLLAAVDASVGGKTAVDLEAGKNLAGAFHQPCLVVFDTGTVDSLPEAQFKEGLAEVIKCGVIADADLFEYVANVEKPSLHEFVSICAEASIRIKRDLVEQDEHDLGVRKLLNFGHTMAHAIEQKSHFEITHGRAVAIGMLAAAKASARLNWSREDCTIPLWQTLDKYGIDTSCPYDAGELITAASRDKKRSGDTISLVVPLAIGEAALMDVSLAELARFFELGLEG